jgi:hypothetical protein
MLRELVAATRCGDRGVEVQQGKNDWLNHAAMSLFRA